MTRHFSASWGDRVQGEMRHTRSQMEGASLAQPRSKRRKDFSRRTGWGPFQKGSACKRHRGMEKLFEERCSKVLVCGSAGPAP